MGFLSREQILSADDIQTADIDVPEWGGTVRVRALNVKEGNEWRRGMLKATPKTNPKTRSVEFDYVFNENLAESANLRMLTLACIDEQGQRLFTLQDVEALAKKNPKPIDRLVRVVRDISGLGQDSEEEAEKNSEPSPSASSSST